MKKTIQGVEVPALGLGTWNLKGEECARAVASALEMGYRHIDTAWIYSNLGEVGEGLRASAVPRGEVFLTDKIWVDHLEPSRLLKQAEDQRKTLRTDYVDLLLIHWPTTAVPLKKTLEALFRLRQDGAARHIGVSNFNSTLLREALAAGPIFCNQVEYHPLLSQRTLLEICRKEDLLLTAYSPLARGEVTGEPVLQDIARKHGRNPAQVALRWLLQQEQVAAIPKASSPAHLKENLEALRFELDEEDMRRIKALPKDRRQVRAEGLAPVWDED